MKCSTDHHGADPLLVADSRTVGQVITPSFKEPQNLLTCSHEPTWTTLVESEAQPT
jgi:hypothetical protein